MLRVPSTRSEEDLVVDLLDRDDVLVHPGFFFDFPHEAFIVVSLLPEPRCLPRACGACWSGPMPERGARGSTAGRHAGVLVPLFSIPSRRSWGIGEIPDLVPLSRWLDQAGLDFVQFLPLNEMQEGQSSPYSALSAMALDPVFIAVDDVDEWVAAGDEALAAEDRAALARRAGPLASTTPSCAHSRVARCGGRSSGSRTSRGEQAIVATARCGRSRNASAGGWTTTACFVRCTMSTAGGTGATGSPG